MIENNAIMDNMNNQKAFQEGALKGQDPLKMLQNRIQVFAHQSITKDSNLT